MPSSARPTLAASFTRAPSSWLALVSAAAVSFPSLGSPPLSASIVSPPSLPLTSRTVA
ncbi:hypothetical protein PF004_g29396 [Phytophthora fragariae]|uniref:Uncharacterized protein n=1 Tax=Phytophthora fragariae TaxID=53985 RepID=A0A6G0MEW3_9STRA|nr:hypothetical protein PF004_g29396 [Phytophthora fragariae]